MTARAFIREADLRRVAKIAREQDLPVCVELPNGTKLHFGKTGTPRAANTLDDMFS